jgi:putative peptidoglycan lipid II flippase
VTLNVVISLSFFKQVGFIIIPIATSISTWVGVIFYFILLKRLSYLNYNFQLLSNTLKVIFSTFLMSIVLYYGLSFFAENLNYSNKFKSIYLLFTVIFVATFYLISCYLLGILNFKNYKTN